ncbi:endonuclease/exonuclease/phosphatase family protein [Nostoc sp. 'Lobaria pulmonaria (5183) cyanobiont']|uniref:endonuclease/exonuclease/phosphatase family protein n=1 Tax=Nostoc sp. 'Lobaria pulmonaria (5183) cyanobiont' TaxID=1618022 RepID=UPI000CF33A9B|nr:endonuclease/exonuclease/phosphatase family protein [Nostoc sp. 'Lobaria pulmonaria (5183) cyanobiont']AVH72583.1 endonuclease/exonuclease/phosphatase [Nostoc sp. 'Lobaria pulmonaria (5183) cyanobiont']
MPNIQEHVNTLITKFVPGYRFFRLQELTIDKNNSLQTEINSNSIKVLSWNIAKQNYNNAWLEDFSKIIATYQPNFIFLQEFSLKLEADEWATWLKMNWNFAPNFVDIHHQTYSGIFTASTIKPITKKVITTKHYEPIVKTPKISLITEYLLSEQNTTILTINTHLINFVDLNKFKIQLNELERALSTHRGPLIFSGDFNTWSRKRAVILNQVTTQLGLTPVIFAPDEKEKIKRFLLSPPLDHIFYRNLSVKKASAKVLDQICSSDHKPLLAEFTYINPQKN